MHTNVRYNDPSQDVNDKKAIEDIKDWLDDDRWEIVKQLAENTKTHDWSFQNVNIGLAFAGITGYPVHAMGRVFCPVQYEKWVKEGDPS